MRVVEWSDLAALPSPAQASALPSSFAGEAPDIRSSAITIGVFDGIHRGHQALIGRIVGKSANLIPTVITFRKNPKEFLKKNNFKGDILTLNQKLSIFEHLAVARIVLIDFSEKFSKLNGKEFLDLVRNRLYPGFVAVGSNFRCGHRGDTDAVRVKALYRETGIPVDVVAPVLEGAHPVSSSRIRSAIVAGDFSAAARLLGRNVELDVSSIVPEDRNGGAFYQTAAIMPRPGMYPVTLYSKNAVPGIKDEVVILKDGILIPRIREGGAFARIEFIRNGEPDL
jgi:riboflavin kinase/FMN adenylyltransferase